MSGLLHSAVALQVCQPPPHPILPKQEFSVLQTASLLKTKILCSTPAASATTRTFSVCGDPPRSVPLCGEKQLKMVWTCK